MASHHGGAPNGRDPGDGRSDGDDRHAQILGQPVQRFDHGIMIRAERCDAAGETAMVAIAQIEDVHGALAQQSVGQSKRQIAQPPNDTGKQQDCRLRTCHGQNLNVEVTTMANRALIVPGRSRMRGHGGAQRPCHMRDGILRRQTIDDRPRIGHSIVPQGGYRLFFIEFNSGKTGRNTQILQRAQLVLDGIQMPEVQHLGIIILIQIAGVPATPGDRPFIRHHEAA